MTRSIRCAFLSIVLVFILTTGIAADAQTFTLIHVNDTHSHLDATGPKTANFEGTLGGMAKAATIINEIRAKDSNVLLLHAGDVFQGDFFFNAYLGIPEFQLMRQLGFDAMAVGNHEFDLGPDTFAYSLSRAYPIPSLGVPLLSANLDLSGYPALGNWIQPGIIKSLGGTSVGIFGMTIPDSPTTNSGAVKILGGSDSAGLQVLMEIVYSQAASLRSQGAKVVILLSHLGYLYDQAVAQKVPGIDIIVGGHDHYEFSQPVLWTNPVQKQVIYVQAGMHYANVGSMHFKLTNSGECRLIDYSLIPVGKTIPPAPAVKAVVDQLKAGIVAKYGDVYKSPVSFAPFEITTSNPRGFPAQDSGMGNLLTDAMRAKTGTEIAVTVNGLISEGISRGFVVGADIFRPVAYGYDPATGLDLNLATFKITGLGLLQGIETTLAFVGINPDFFVQVSGMSYAYNATKPVGQRIIPALVFVGGKPINPAKTYTVTANVGLVAVLPLLAQMGGFQDQYGSVEILPDLEYPVLKSYIAKRSMLLYGPQFRILDLRSALRITLP